MKEKVFEKLKEIEKTSTQPTSKNIEIAWERVAEELKIEDSDVASDFCKELGISLKEAIENESNEKFWEKKLDDFGYEW